MLYCPKCQRTYEEGAQRFCTADNARLLPSSAAPSSSARNVKSAENVFTNIFNRAAPSSAASGDAESSSAPSLKQRDTSRTLRGAFTPPPTSKIFKPEAKVEQEIEKSARTQAQIVKNAPPPFELPLEIPNKKPFEKTAAPTTTENSALQKDSPRAVESHESGVVDTFDLHEDKPSFVDAEHAAEKSMSQMPDVSGQLQDGAAQTETLSAAVAASDVPAEFVGERVKENAAAKIEPTNLSEELAHERRAISRPAAKAKTNWAIPSLLGAIIALSSFGLWYFMPRRTSEPQAARNVASPINNDAPQPKPETPALETTQPAAEIESQPPARTIEPPQNFVYFENSKQNLKDDAAKNFLGFSLYFPKDWKQNDAKNNFLDVSKNTSSGTPVEQMLVSFYDSRGTFGEDKEIFPLLVSETSRKLGKIVPKFQIVSKGETTINGGWRAYEVKFVGAGKTAKGEDIKLWGKRLFVPAERGGVKNGYVLTLLATSFSPEVKSVEDVGVKGDLNKVLGTFEPARNF